jgi:hypothetical protein
MLKGFNIISGTGYPKRRGTAMGDYKGAPLVLWDGCD